MTLGDETSAWLATGDGLLPAIGAVFLVLVVTIAVVVSARAMWEGLGKS